MSTSNTDPIAGAASSAKPKKKSLYQRYQDAKHGRNKQISDEDLVKFTGKTRADINEWGKTQPGVAGNQAAGKLDMGPATGLGGMAAGEGYGGWGPGAKGDLKFPPKPAATEGKSKEVEDSE